MKCIVKAMTETEFRPRPKWWGFVDGGRRYLMRYHHCFAVFSETEVLSASYQTVTDKRGVEFAVKHFLETRTKSAVCHSRAGM
jgi:hypothetical protein